MKNLEVEEGGGLRLNLEGPCVLSYHCFSPCLLVVSKVQSGLQQRL